jgi:hypothetical protein
MPPAEQSSGRVLLDECVPRRLARDFADLQVSHALDEGWAGQRNGTLLRSMQSAGFAVLVTVDRNLQFQQNIAAAGVAVIVIHARSNRLVDLRPFVPLVSAAVVKVRRGEVVHVGV